MSLTGDRIREYRIKRGLSVQELAEKIGKNRSTIYKYEDERIEKLPYAVIGDIARVLYVSPAYLMGWTDDPEIKNTATITADNDGIEMTDRDKLMLILFDQLDDEKKEVLIRTMKDLLNSQK